VLFQGVLDFQLPLLCIGGD
jgi:hypothetical protein